MSSTKSGPNQYVKQNVCIKVNGSERMIEENCNSENNDLLKDLVSGLSTLSSFVHNLPQNIPQGLVIPANLSTLSTSIGLTNKNLGNLETEFLDFINNDYIPEINTLTIGLSSLSTAIGIPNKNQSIGANISTINPMFSSLLINVSSIYYSTQTNILGNVNYTNGLNIGSNLNIKYNNHQTLFTQNSEPILYFSTLTHEISNIYYSSTKLYIPITDSSRQMNIIMSGVNGVQVSTSGAVGEIEGDIIYGGYGAWLDGKLNLPKSYVGKNYELVLPSTTNGYLQTYLGVVETNELLIVVGNGGEPGYPGISPNVNNSNIGLGGDALPYLPNTIPEYWQSTNTLYYYSTDGADIFVSCSSFGGTTATYSANGFGGSNQQKAADIDSKYGDIDYTGQEGQGGGVNTLNSSSGGIGANYIEYFSVNTTVLPNTSTLITLSTTLYIDTPAHFINLSTCSFGGGGNGGAGYYSGGGGSVISGSLLTNFSDEGSKDPNNLMASGGGGGSTWINENYVNYNDGGTNGNLPEPLASVLTFDATAMITYKINEVCIYGGLRLAGPDGTNFLFNSFNNSLLTDRV